MLARGLTERAAAGRPSILSSEVEKLLKDADLRFGNLESPLAAIASPTRPRAFRAPITGANFLTHFDVLSLANNHVFDCGDDGIAETLGALASQGIRQVGVSEDPDRAYEPLLLATSAATLAVFGCTSRRNLRVPPGSRFTVPLAEDRRLDDAIRRAAGSAGFVVVLFHGGTEYVPYPPPSVRARLRQLSGLGANLIVTHHPHVLGGYETVGENVLIWYSLGDFVFDSRVPRRRRSGILSVEVNPPEIRSFRLVPTCAADDATVLPADPGTSRKIEAGVDRVSRSLSSRWYRRGYPFRYVSAVTASQFERLVCTYRERGPRAALAFVLRRFLLAWRGAWNLLRGGRR